MSTEAMPTRRARGGDSDPPDVGNAQNLVSSPGIHTDYSLAIFLVVAGSRAILASLASLLAMAANEQYFECNEPSVIFERFADETILINLDAGHYYSMDPIGAAVWELLNRGLPVDRIVDVMSARYAPSGEDIGATIRAYVLRMCAEGLIRPRRAPAPAVPADVEIEIPAGAAFSPPMLARYDDMEAMLLLDPVHDVAEVGWPAPAANGDASRTAQIEDDDVSNWPSIDEES